MLLLATCGWIIYEAAQRLLFKSVEVEANAWAFVVMIISIVVDLSRSRALARAAKQHDSQALEADALHFSTDIWSSSVVIVGLVLMRLSQTIPGLEALVHADAVAALGVAAIVLYVSARLGWRTVSVLLDTAPSQVGNTIVEEVRRLPQVYSVRNVRIRRSGPDAFVDLAVVVAPSVTLNEAHGIASQTERLVQSLVPRADVVVHVEPANLPSNGHDTIVAALRGAASELNLQVHGIRILRLGESYHVEAHAEIGSDLSLAQAHGIVSQFERSLRARVPTVADVITHIEPFSSSAPRSSTTALDLDVRRLASEAESLAQRMWGPASCHKVQVHTISGRPSLSMHCVLSPELSVNEAHELTEAFEDAIRQRYPALDRVLVHSEPPAG